MVTAYLDSFKTHDRLLDKVTSSSFAKMVFLSAVQLFFVLVYSFALVSSNTNISTNDSGQDIGEYEDNIMAHGAVQAWL